MIAKIIVVVNSTAVAAEMCLMDTVSNINSIGRQIGRWNEQQIIARCHRIKTEVTIRVAMGRIYKRVSRIELTIIIVVFIQLNNHCRLALLKGIKNSVGVKVTEYITGDFIALGTQTKKCNQNETVYE